MKRYANKVSPWSGLMIGMALGALAMYAMDPRQGKRRLHEARDKLYSTSLKTRKLIDAKSRHFSNRARGLQAKASHLLQ
ncbi:YtxH domain-containing protein [Oxalobacteraceae bacterium R-40]|uniref:YtxH domain-containing protein n=1 Tax=Keguizhuia sedimenti TaxID=3064264 RepID=A0ABU1BL14_9BURK|nr:YtxH domain-containing protein [Oxalobacteraceae bacterium R-40]